VSTSDRIAKVTDSSSVELSDSGNLAAEVGGGVTAGFFGLCVGAVLGPDAGALVGMTLTPVSERWIARSIKEIRPRSQVLAEGASLTSGLSEEEVVERLVDSPELQPLVVRILDAAARTNSTETLRLLGAMLGASVADRARRVDEDLMLVDVITGLEPGHLRLLELLEGPADPSNPDLVWNDEKIAAADPDSLTTTGRQIAIGGLLARGVIQSVSVFGGIGYSITDFGRALLDALRWSTQLQPRG
jgi:hypothetical protein